MSAIAIHSQKRFAYILSLLLGHLTTGTLAVVMLVTLAVLNAIRGDQSEIGGSVVPKPTKAEVIIDNAGIPTKSSNEAGRPEMAGINRDSIPHVVMSANGQFTKATVLEADQNFSNSLATTSDSPYPCSITRR